MGYLKMVTSPLAISLTTSIAYALNNLSQVSQVVSSYVIRNNHLVCPQVSHTVYSYIFNNIVEYTLDYLESVMLPLAILSTTNVEYTQCGLPQVGLAASSHVINNDHQVCP